VLFDADEAAEMRFVMMLVDFQRLNDDDAALHLALDHVNFSFAPAP
jgi:hypothetical protein